MMRAVQALLFFAGFCILIALYVAIGVWLMQWLPGPLWAGLSMLILFIALLVHGLCRNAAECDKRMHLK